MPRKKFQRPAPTPPDRADESSASGLRRKATGPTGPALALEPELEARMYALVLRVEENTGGLTLPPEAQWILAADAAKRAGYLQEKAFKLFLTKHGEQWLASRSQPAAKEYTYTKIREGSRLVLKDIAQSTGMPMQEAVGEIIEAIRSNQDGLTRVARKNGLQYPWEAIRHLVK